ncbi:MAG: ABC transporter substrate-binding protein [Acetobacteraceae bacterium]|nr:ABC transporter substrate-binding protein [Acetobacteraceae bacterium]
MTLPGKRPLLLLAALAATLAATPPPAAAQTTLRIGLADDPDALDPTLSRTYVGRIVFAGLCDKLFDIDAKLNVVPQLATGYEYADPTTLLIKLRPGVTFHDGEKFDSAAVKFTLERHQTMQGSTRRGEISAVERIETPDPLTVKLILKSPSSPLIVQFADRSGMIVSPKAAIAAGADFGKHPVCTGPFKFAERVPQDRIVLERFDGYWNAKAIALNRVVYRPIVDATVRLANLQAGAIDFGERFQPSDVPEIRNDPKLVLVQNAGLGFQSILFNHKNGTGPRTPMMTDARVRQAFALSIDRTVINQVVYGGIHTPNAHFVPPSSPFYSDEVKAPARDVARARALLAEAGVKTPYTVELMLANNPDLRQAGEVIQSMAAEAGFDVKLRSTEFVTALQASDKGDYEMFLIGWSGRADPDGNVYSFVHTGPPNLNAAGYSNAQVDSWLEEARRVSAVPERRALYTKVALQLLRDLPRMYLYTPNNIFAMSTRVKGFVPVPDGMVRLHGMSIAP